MKTFKKLRETIDLLVSRFDEIPEARRQTLERLAGVLSERAKKKRSTKLVFICTHNSRRSQMAELWAAVAAAHYGVVGIEPYSGGTEATAFDSRAVAALERAGFRFENPGGENPRYEVRYTQNVAPIECFSKTYDDPSNPQHDFVAVMTCSEANEACPVVHGAAIRVSLPYADPKIADGTPEESEAYEARSRQIASEMLYLFSEIR
jgi:arsenate reductase